ncbi:MAG: hypothetical protein CFE25_03435 [Chitinophagaceae bacterium BSSC1]|nr:MAG: hypothetical protein CFE25_03435 [Chitinophagaceae bacterium BSSC1]
MKSKLLLPLSLLLYLQIQAQTSLELKSLRYHNNSGKTLNYLELSQTKASLNKILDSLSKKYWQIPSQLANELIIQKTNASLSPSIIQLSLIDPKLGNAKHILLTIDSSKQGNKSNPNYFLNIEMAELPMSSLNKLINIDSSLRKRFLSAPKIGLFQIIASIQLNNGDTVFKKTVSLLIYRNKRVKSFGFPHPDYGISPKNFENLLAKGLSIVLDQSNTIGLLEIEYDQVKMNDYFIQPFIQDQPKVFISSEKNSLQYLWKDQMQYLQYEEPGYEEIYLTKKEKDSLPKNLIKEIRAVDLRYPFFALEDSRDIFSDKNYTLKATVYALRNSADEPRTFTYNVRTGLPLVFVNGKTHIFLKDRDTLAHFKVSIDTKDSKKQKFLHQIVETYNGSSITMENKPRTSTQQYAFIIEGAFKGMSLKINCSGMRGMQTVIREIYLNNKLIAIAQGSTSPEILTVLDKNLDSVTLNQLLLLSFSRLF